MGARALVVVVVACARGVTAWALAAISPFGIGVVGLAGGAACAGTGLLRATPDETSGQAVGAPGLARGATTLSGTTAT